MSSMPTISVAGKPVGRMGYGLMQLTWGHDIPSQETSLAAMKAAADSGATCWSSATFYGPHENPYANLELIATFFAKYPEYKSKIVLVVKGGMDLATLSPKGNDVDFVRGEVLKTKEILGDKEIDVFSLARLPDGPVESTFEGLVTLQKEGLFNAIGVSEMGVKSLEKAIKVTPIAVNEIEVSLFSYEADIRATVAWCTKNRVPIFAYSPLGAGLLTRTYKSPDDIPKDSVKAMFPRFQGEAFYENLKLVDILDGFAEKRGVKTSQLALAWVLGLSDIAIPIPGSSKADRVRENNESTQITLTPEEYAEINKILDGFEVKGDRYPPFIMAHVMK
ncbi:hypothetical protein IAT38_005316 [Cryptococcus sp. DSM 104549]